MACASLSDAFCKTSYCKECRDCKDRCTSFSLSSSQLKACKSGCEADPYRYYSVDEFLSGTASYVSPEEELQKAQIDATKDAQTSSIIKYLIGTFIIIIVLFTTIYLYKNAKK